MRGNQDYEIRRADIIKALGFDSKLPADFHMCLRRLDIDRYMRDPISVMVQINPSTKSDGAAFRHRIMIRCGCGKFVPFGRLPQHRAACNKELCGDPNNQ
jgi:hypothetical protein